jgi:hypothetical protein
MNQQLIMALKEAGILFSEMEKDLVKGKDCTGAYVKLRNCIYAMEKHICLQQYDGVPTSDITVGDISKLLKQK